MNNLEINYIFNTVILIPIMIFIIFFYLKSEINKLHNNLILELTILLIYFSSLYIFIRINNIKYIYYLTIPILLCFIYDKYKISIFLSLINILVIKLFNINILFVIIYHIILFILYFIIKNKKLFINIFTINNGVKYYLNK